MACYHPIKGYMSFRGDKRKFIPSKLPPPGEPVMQVPCGQCIGCRLDKSREWALRMVHELKFHNKACFITLTYAKEPKNGTLVKKDYQDFMKRLRKKYPGRRISYFHCGEYGEVCESCGKSFPYHNTQNKIYNGCTNWLPTIGRPHYHAILYGVDFSKKKKLPNGTEIEVGLELHKRTRAGNEIYKSKELEKIWGHGFCTIGSVTFESCAYVSRYVTKKMNGKKADEHYKRYELTEGGKIQSFQLLPEYATMSRNPAIGLRWLQVFASDIYPIRS